MVIKNRISEGERPTEKKLVNSKGADGEYFKLLNAVPLISDLTKLSKLDVNHLILGTTLEKLYFGLTPKQKNNPSMFLKLFHSLVVFSLTSGMTSAILVVDLTFDLKVLRVQMYNDVIRSEDFMPTFYYYDAILNSPTVCFKVIHAASD